MKVIFLAGANSVHTARWADGLASRGHEVHLVSAHPLDFLLDERVVFHRLHHNAPLAYALSAPEVRNLIEKIRPDILNAHYATGYGQLARLVAFKPLLLSVWGSDIYDFPEKSFIHRALVRSNLKSATAIASTSKCMARKVAEILSHKHIFITPFGVDVSKFKPEKSRDKTPSEIIIGTVKTLSWIYGLDMLVRAFAYAWEKIGRPSNMFLEITGVGPDRKLLDDLVLELGLSDQVRFWGAIAHEQVPDMLNRMDLYVALSRFESFGVAIMEASACEIPVLVSDAEGLAEVTRDGVIGVVVPRNTFHAAGEAIFGLIQNPEFRKKLGVNGRKHVIENYAWNISLDVMTDAYTRTIQLASESK